MSKRIAWLSLAACLLCGSVGYALTGLTARQAAWQPLLTLWGSGDKVTAVTEMRRVASASEAFLHGRKVDQGTQAFVDGVLADLGDFKLSKLHQRLPVEDKGYRELWVRGDLRGREYLVRQAPRGFAVTLSSEHNELGAASLLVRAKRLWNVNEREAYSLAARVGLGIGNVRWDVAVAAAEEAARVASTGNPELHDAQAIASSAAARKRAQTAHPQLSAEDLDVLAVAYEAFPALSDFVSKFGTLENVRTVWSDRGYQQMTIAVRGSPAKYAKEFPLVAKYASGLSDIVRARGRWVDMQGRTLAAATVDSKELTATVSCYLRDGRLLPSRGDEVLETQPVDPMSEQLARSKLIGSADLKLFGVTIGLSGLELAMNYQPHDSWAELGASFTKLPKVVVSGAALGFIPTELVDAFIPGTIEGLTRDFLGTAASAHHDQGATASLKVGTATSHGALEAEGELVALDNALIQMAVSMVNERLLPTPALIAEVERVADGAHGAFMRDLTAYEADRSLN